jgi:hypothetical protein
MGQPEEPAPSKWPTRIGIALALGLVALAYYGTFVLGMGVKSVEGLPARLVHSLPL